MKIVIDNKQEQNIDNNRSSGPKNVEIRNKFCIFCVTKTKIYQKLAKKGEIFVYSNMEYSYTCDNEKYKLRQYVNIPISIDLWQVTLVMKL